MSKFALIYQFNNRSPLFARVADDALSNNLPDKAIHILEDGINHHPDYPTAYLIYAKALAAKGDFEQAREVMKTSMKLLDDQKTYDYYLNEIERIESEKNESIDPKQTSFLEDDLNDFQTNSEFVFDDQIESELSENYKAGINSVEENLDQLINELNEAKLSIQDPGFVEEENLDVVQDELSEEIEEQTASKFISETLADIYLTQGNLIQAKNIYQKLLELEPEKKERFQQKIDRINKQLEGN